MGVFDGLTDRLGKVFSKWSGADRLSEARVEEGLREIRIALLEADVNLKVATEFLESVREKATGTHILLSLDPVQMIVKIVRDELIELLGGKDVEPPDELSASFNPILLLGLQGSGKTTTAAKLALHFKKQGAKTMLAALDMSRPAAIDQLEVLAGEIDVPVYVDRNATPVEAAKAALDLARKEGIKVLLMDSAGRLHIDDELMDEVRTIKEVTNPVETFLVVDAMTGQDAVNIAETFDAKVGITGLCVTKFDGDARAGAALSVKSVTGKPIRWVGTGEKVGMIEPFIPERMASRILGMGDMLSLIEKAEQEMDASEAERITESFAKGKFDVDDFLVALGQMKKLGPIKQVLGMLPGVQVTDELVDMGEERLKVVRAIAHSMTKGERRRPEILDTSRKRRISSGSGTKVEDINQFLDQFGEMQKMMKMMGAGGRGMMNMMSGGTTKPLDGPLGTMPVNAKQGAMPIDFGSGFAGGGGLSGGGAGFAVPRGAGKTKSERAKAKAAKKSKQAQRKRKKKKRK
ncbi:signal recognition particle protein [bacterium]|nr:signal recognition particle protein [bacterium]